MWDFIKNNKIVAGILGLLVSSIIGYALYRWNKKLKELADLRTKLEIQEIDLKQKWIDAAQDKTVEEIASLEKEISTKLFAIKTMKTSVSMLENSYKKTISEIKDIKTWDQLKNYQASH